MLARMQSMNLAAQRRNARGRGIIFARQIKALADSFGKPIQKRAGSPFPLDCSRVPRPRTTPSVPFNSPRSRIPAIPWRNFAADRSMPPVQHLTAYNPLQAEKRPSLEHPLPRHAARKKLRSAGHPFPRARRARGIPAVVDTPLIKKLQSGDSQKGLHFPVPNSRKFNHHCLSVFATFCRRLRPDPPKRCLSGFLHRFLPFFQSRCGFRFNAFSFPVQPILTGFPFAAIPQLHVISHAGEGHLLTQSGSGEQLLRQNHSTLGIPLHLSCQGELQFRKVPQIGGRSHLRRNLHVGEPLVVLLGEEQQRSTTRGHNKRIPVRLRHDLISNFRRDDQAVLLQIKRQIKISVKKGRFQGFLFHSASERGF